MLSCRTQVSYHCPGFIKESAYFFPFSNNRATNKIKKKLLKVELFIKYIIIYFNPFVLIHSTRTDICTSSSI